MLKITEHEEKQNRLRALRNRQDLFQEEGILNLILEAIDKINVITSQGFLVALAGDEAGQNWEVISGYLYQLLGESYKSISSTFIMTAHNVKQSSFLILYFATELNALYNIFSKGNHIFPNMRQPLNIVFSFP